MRLGADRRDDPLAARDEALVAPTPGEQDRFDVALALLRVVLVPLLLAGESLLEHPGGRDDLFRPLAIFYSLWAVVLLAIHVAVQRGHRPAPARLAIAEPVVDLLMICGLTYTSGGAFSQLRLAFFALPVISAFRLRPMLTAVWGAATVVAFIALSLPHPATQGKDARDAVLVHAGYLAWAAAAAVLVSRALAVRNRRIARNAAERGLLVARALEAEERERRRLAQILHDDAVQDLLLARQELRDLRRTGSEEAAERTDEALARAVAQLRGEIFELRPYILDHAGLAAALQTLGERHGARAGASVTVEVDPAASGPHDELLASVARELLTNAAKHSGASRIALRVTRDNGTLALEVADDGRGFTADEQAAATEQGHIGLASVAERVAALGGTLDVDSAPGAGARVAVRLPVN